MNKYIKIWTLGLAFALAFVACGDSKNAQNGDTQKVYKVGSESSYAPFSYVERDGSVSGYDIEVLKALSKIDPSLKFEFITAPWDALFVGLDSLRFDMLANQIISTPERVEKYILNSEPYLVSVSEFVVKEDSKYQHINDLKGAKIGAVVGSAHTKILEE